MANGVIPAIEWERVSRRVAASYRYFISLNTLYELLAGLAGCDEAHFETNRNRIRTLYPPFKKSFLPLVGDYVRMKIFQLPPRRLDFQPNKFKLWVDVILAAKSRDELAAGKVRLRKAGHSSKEYGFSFPMLQQQIEQGKAVHAVRLEQLRDGSLLRSTPETWATAVRGLIGVDVNDESSSKLLAGLDAAYHFDVSLWNLAKDKNYDFREHDSDWLDSQQFVLFMRSSGRVCNKGFQDQDAKQEECAERANNGLFRIREGSRCVLVPDFTGKDKRSRCARDRFSKLVPHQGHSNYESAESRNQVTQGRAGTPSGRLSHFGTHQIPIWGGNGPGGSRTRTCNLDGVPCCHYTTGPRPERYPYADAKSMVIHHTANLGFPNWIAPSGRIKVSGRFANLV